MEDFEVKFTFNATCADDLQQSSDNSMIGTFTSLNYTEMSTFLILICICCSQTDLGSYNLRASLVSTRIFFCGLISLFVVLGFATELPDHYLAI